MAILFKHCNRYFSGNIFGHEYEYTDSQGAILVILQYIIELSIMNFLAYF